MLYIDEFAVGGTRPAWTVAEHLAFSQTLIRSVGSELGHYCLPLTFVALVVMFMVWRLHRREWERACEVLKQATELKQQLERERDQAQEELLRRLYEDRELNKQKFQFQAQLAEYEKYSTLAQLALGAAHGINNPLLGILSHLELELKSASILTSAGKSSRCIAGHEADFRDFARAGELRAAGSTGVEQPESASSGGRYA